MLSGLAWLVLGYVVPWTAVLGRQERPVVASANGTWFIWVVASQSVAVAAATIEPVFAGGRRELALLAVMSWSVGVFLYGAAGLLVSRGAMLYSFGPKELTPPYWVSMGALAITVLAGARIVEMADAPMVQATRDLIAGLAVVFWAFATWLIPVLVAAGWWRHVSRNVPLRYEATLREHHPSRSGCNAVAGIYLGEADDLPVARHGGPASRSGGWHSQRGPRWSSRWAGTSCAPSSGCRPAAGCSRRAAAIARLGSTGAVPRRHTFVRNPAPSAVSRVPHSHHAPVPWMRSGGGAEACPP